MMLSRVAETLYWMARYLERAEHTARLLEQALHVATDSDADGAGAEAQWRSLLSSLGCDASGPMTPDAMTRWLTFDTDNPLSVARCMTQARENASQAREQLSSEMFEQLNRLYLSVRDADPAPTDGAEPYDLLRAVQLGSQTFQGVTDATMSHGEDWCFIQVGRNIERAQCTARLLDVHLGQGASSTGAAFEAREYLLWVMLLRSCLAFEPYTKHYGPEFKLNQIVEFLLLNADFPRSMHHNVRQIELALARIGKESSPYAQQDLDRLTGRLVASLKYGEIDGVVGGGLHEFLSRTQSDCNAVHEALFQVYIRYPVEKAAS